MNAKIQRILDICTEDILGVKTVNQEKFAKLLIEECAEVCYNLKFTHDGPGEQAAYQRILCGTSIRENFGLVSKGPISALNVQ